MGNSHYWDNKEQRKALAIAHTKSMSYEYQDEIDECIKNTIEYTGPLNVLSQYNKIPIILDDLDTVSAAHKYKEGKTAILNFASYKNPGGGFLNGSCAQEECLCHDSYLYNILSQKMDYYNWNRQHLNKALYLDRALYTPNVRFASDYYDVLTCASPNFSAASKYQNVSAEANNKVLEERIKFLLEVAALNKVDTLILGAFGCGVFSQNPTIVCKYFCKYIYQYDFKKVIFAIPVGQYNRNFQSFKEELEKLKNE